MGTGDEASFLRRARVQAPLGTRTEHVRPKRFSAAFRSRNRALHAVLELVFAIVLLVIGLWPGNAAAQSLGGSKLTDSGEAPRETVAASAAPGDAPSLNEKQVRIPAPPASFNTYDGGWIRFSYHPSERERVQPLIAQADQFRSELSERLGRSVLHEVQVRIARTPGEMATLAPDGIPFPSYAAGVAYSEIGLVLLTIKPVHPNSKHELSEIFKHELAHVALHDAVGRSAVPRWFNEGFAVFVSGESSMVRLQALWLATVGDHLLELKQLQRSFPADSATASIAYAQAADVVRFLVRKEDELRFEALIERLRQGESFDDALENAYGTDTANLEFEWRQDVAKRYTFWPVLLSGSVIWVGAIFLFTWGYRKRRTRAKATLARWAREEAAEDEQKRRDGERVEPKPRVHIVFARASRTSSPELRPSYGDTTDIPKVEHEGQWHTLH